MKTPVNTPVRTLDRVCEAIVRRRWLLLGLLVLLVAGVSPGLETAGKQDNSLRVWFLEDDPLLGPYDEFHAQFGNDEVILLQVHDPQGIFRAETLRRLRGLEGSLEAIEGVDRVHSVVSTRDAFQSAEGLRFETVLPEPIPDDPAVIAAAQARTLDNPLFVDRLVSRDGQRAMLWVQMAVMEDFDNRRDAIVGEVRRVADAQLQGLEHPMGGVGVIYSGLNVITQHDFGLFVGLGFLLMFVMMAVIFRSALLVSAAMGVVVVGTLVALGAYGLAGHQLNMVTVMLPLLIIVLGIADAVHFPAALVHEHRRFDGAGAGRPERLRSAVAGLRKILVPCFMTTATTMAGFLALASSPMEVIRSFGVYAAVGIGAALIASVGLMIVAFVRLREGATLPKFPLIRRLLEVCEAAVVRHPIALGLASITLAGLGLGGYQLVVADTYTIGYLPDDHQVVREHEQIEAGWGRYFALELTARPLGERRIDDAPLLDATERFVAEVSALPEIRNGFSLASLYRRMEQVLAPDRAAERPISDALAGQLRLLLDMERFEWDRTHPDYDANVLAPLMVQSAELGRITLVTEMASARGIDDLLGRVLAVGERTYGGLAELEATGYTPLYVQIIDYVMASQVRGFLLALAVIFLLMLAWLRSLRLAIVAVIANVFPVVIMLGTMGALGIDLDIASATIAAIVIGVSIDDTVHFLYHWQRAERDGASWREALRRTYEHAGHPAVITTVLLLAGYPVLMLADVKTVVYFGLLTTVAAAAALYGDLIVLPLLLKVRGGRGRAA